MKFRYKIMLVATMALWSVLSFSAGAEARLKVKKVDFEQVKKDTQDPKSRYYYPRLMKSFQSNDTVMSIDAYRDLYYGYVFQEDYNPFSE